jgi:hypothetical protein
MNPEVTELGPTVVFAWGYAVFRYGVQMGTASAAGRRRTYQPRRLRIPIPLSAIENPDSALGGAVPWRAKLLGEKTGIFAGWASE